MNYNELLLLENKAQYTAMLKPLVDMEVIDNAEAQKVLNFVRKELQRNDRIVWWLKWYRVAAVATITRQVSKYTPEQIAKLEKMVSKNLPAGDVDGAIRQFEGRFRIGAAQMTHYLSMMSQVPAMDALVWDVSVTPYDMDHALMDLEIEWQESADQEIDVDQYDDPNYAGRSPWKKVIDYGKQAWVLIDKDYCELEGDAMGHCGNQQSRSGDERILSFRTIINDTRQKPHLTFIISPDGVLGEMKGRANEKPAKKYHKVIVDLLASDMVSDIKGGGHDPANNFSINDLDDEVRAALIAKKPSLASLYDRYYAEGLTPAIEDLIHNKIDALDLNEIDSIDVASKDAILVKYYNISALSNDFYWTPLEEAVAANDARNDDIEITDDDINEMSIPVSEVNDILSYIQSSYLKRIATDLGITGDLSDPRIVFRIADDFSNSKYEKLMNKGVLTVYHEDNAAAITDENWAEYISILVGTLSSALNGNDSYLTDKQEDGTYSIIMDISNLVTMLSADVDDLDNEHAYDLALTQSEGWASFDDYNATDEWDNIRSGEDDNQQDEKGIVPKITKLLADDDGEVNVDWENLDVQQVAKWFMDELDVVESVNSNDLSNAISEMKRRAGLT
jgi:hypothetical protein